VPNITMMPIITEWTIKLMLHCIRGLLLGKFNMI